MADQMLPEILFDKRLQERFIRPGLLTQKQLDEWLSKLGDVQEQGEPCLPPEREDKNKGAVARG
jgi:hypothetical protein